MATSSSPRLFTSLRYDSILLESTNNGGLSAPKQPFSPVYMLRYHRDRLVEAAKEFHLDPILAQLEQNHQGLFFLHKTIMDHVQEAEKHVGRAKALKIRVVFGPDGAVDIDSSEVPPVMLEDLFPSTLADPEGHVSKKEDQDDQPKMLQQWTVVLDYQRTAPSPFTTYKTLERKDYIASRARAKILSFQKPREVLLVNRDEEIMEGSLTSVYFYRGGRWVTPPLTSGGQAGTTRRWALKQGLCVEEVVLASDVKDGEECYLSNGVRGFFRARVQLQQP